MRCCRPVATLLALVGCGRLGFDFGDDTPSDGQRADVPDLRLRVAYLKASRSESRGDLYVADALNHCSQKFGVAP